MGVLLLFRILEGCAGGGGIVSLASEARGFGTIASFGTPGADGEKPRAATPLFAVLFILLV